MVLLRNSHFSAHLYVLFSVWYDHLPNMQTHVDYIYLRCMFSKVEEAERLVSWLHYRCQSCRLMWSLSQPPSFKVNKNQRFWAPYNLWYFPTYIHPLTHTTEVLRKRAPSLSSHARATQEPLRWPVLPAPACHQLSRGQTQAHPDNTGRVRYGKGMRSLGVAGG